MNQFSKRLFFCLSIASFILFGLLFSTSAYAKEKTSLSVGVDSGQQAYLQAIALEKGYFSNNNLNVKLVNYSAGIDTLNGIALDQVQIGAAYDYATVSRIAVKNELTIIGTAVRDTGGFFEVRDSIKTKKQLKGKKIGLQKGTAQ